MTTTDIELAFAHPEDRAEASASADPRDRISLRDHIVEADIGAFQQERGHRQRLRFNVVVEVRPVTEPLMDDVDRILSYDRITEAIAAELAAERLNLLETLAERVADRVLAEPAAMRVFIRIEKLDVGPYALGVEIARSRAARPQAAAEDRRFTRWWSFWTMPRLPSRPCGPAGCLAGARGAADPGRGPAGPGPGRSQGTSPPSAGSTFWPLSRTPGPLPPATRAAWWWPRGPRSTGRCGAGRRWSGRRPSWCWMRWTARRAARRSRWRFGWRKRWGRRALSFTEMLRFRQEAAFRSRGPEPSPLPRKRASANPVAWSISDRLR
jgi:dihydroneopterin aldolase